MSKQIVQNVKGTRDFYPEDKAYQNWFYQKVKKVSEKYGYQEFDGPEIEYMDLYSDKTSEEILKEQSFTMLDRDGRPLMLRPELTPTFARMVAQKSQTLQKPIRWWMFGRCWRYEKPQRGRGREFFQWEIDILGPETPEADAEILIIAADFFKELGLKPNEVVLRVSDRSYFDQIIRENGIPQEKFTPLLRIIDRIEKISEDEFIELLKSEGLNKIQIESLQAFFTDKDYTQSPWLSKVFENIAVYPELMKYIEYDPTIARGFDYYTRTVFEAWDKSKDLRRSIYGGGRFDNLTSTLGGDRVPGVGMAPGDMPIKEILQQYNKMPILDNRIAQILVTVFNEETKNYSAQIARDLRQSEYDTELWVEPEVKLEKQLKYAIQKGIKYVVIAGTDEVQSQKVTVKNLETREQSTIPLNKLNEWLSNQTK